MLSENRSPRSSSQENPRWGEAGNVFFTLFGAVALVGVVGVATSTLMRGPVGTVVKLNQSAKADAQMQIAHKLAMLEAVQANPATSGDCDSDGYVEPLGPVACANGLTGGGCLPASIGASQIDPWGTSYGYCAWDHGGMIGDVCVDAGVLDGTNASNQTVIAIISAGTDRTFQSICAADPGYITTGGDDLVVDISYAGAVEASGGLWSLKSGDPGTATIDKEVEVGEEVRFQSGGQFSGGAFDTPFTLSDTRLEFGSDALLALPNQSTVGSTGASTIAEAGGSTLPERCNGVGANSGSLRINTGDGALMVLEICDPGTGWIQVGGSGSSAGAADPLGSVQFSDGAGGFLGDGAFTYTSAGGGLLTAPDVTSTGVVTVGGNLVVNGTLADINANADITGTLDVSGTSTLGVLNSGATTTGSLTATGAADMDAGLNVDGASTLDGVTADGTVVINNTLSVVGANATTLGGTLTVAGDIDDSDGAVTFNDADGVDITQGTLDVTEDVIARSFRLNGDGGAFDDGLFYRSLGGLELRTQGAGRLFIDEAGDIGLGISAPTTMLDVAGEIRLRSAGGANVAGASCGGIDGALTYTSGDELLVCSSITGNWETIGTSGGGGSGAATPWDEFTDYIAREDSTFIVNQGSDITFASSVLEGAGVRMIWYPSAGGLRAGEVTGSQWDNGQFGQNSTAFGLDTVASADGTFAAGTSVEARGAQSIALGNEAIVAAGATNSMALGLGDQTGGIPQVQGANSLGIFMGDLPTLGAFTAANTMGIFGGDVILSSGGTETSATGALLLDVEGRVGATEYCSQNDAFCFTAEDVATGSVGIPGADTEVLFNSGGAMGSDPGFVFLQSTNRLGLGTAAPQAPLHIFNDTSSPAIIVERATLGDSNFINFFNENGVDKGSIGLTSAGDFLTISATDSTAAHVAFLTNDGALAERMRLTSAGRLGIGTITPEAQLHITEQFILGNVNDCTAATQGALRLNAGGDVLEMCDFAGSGGYVAIGGASVSAPGSDRQVIFNSGGSLAATTGFVFDSSGRFGVGLDNPDDILDVVGTAEITGATVLGSTLDVTGATTLNSTLNVTDQVTFVSGMDVAQNAIFSADVGIGDTTPDGTLLLDVEGQVGADQYCDENGANCFLPEDVADQTVPGADTEVLFNSGGVMGTDPGFVFVSSNNRLGLGTASPAAQIHISSDLTPWMRFEAPGVGGDYATIGALSNEYLRLRAESGFGLSFGTDGVDERMVFTSAGRLAIGTSTPSTITNEDVHIFNSGTTAGILVEADDTVAAVATLHLRADAKDFFIQSFDAGTVTALDAQDGMDISFRGNGVERMIIQNSGEVGIGSASPQTLLDVDGTIKIDYGGEACDVNREGGIHYNSSDNNFYVCPDGVSWQRVITAGGGGTPAGGADRQVQFNSGGSLEGDANFIYTSSGKFGIGVSSFNPADSADLRLNDVDADGTTLMRFTNATSGTLDSDGVAIGYEDGLGGAIFWNREATEMLFGTDNTERMRLTSAGRLGIGTATPDSRFTMQLAGQALIGDAAPPTARGNLQVTADDTGIYDRAIDARNTRTSGTYNIAVAGTAVGATANTNVALYGWAASGTTNRGLWVESGDILLEGQTSITSTLNVTDDSTLGGLVRLTSTGALVMNVGTTAQRPGVPEDGMFRFNDDTNQFEGYNGTDWNGFMTGSAGNDREVLFNSGGAITGDPALIFTNTGQVGIGPGVTPGTSILYVSAATNTAEYALTLENAGASGDFINMTNRLGNDVFEFNQSTAGDGTFIMADQNGTTQIMLDTDPGNGFLSLASAGFVTGGEEDLELFVFGDTGSINYCDEDGNDCFTAAEVAVLAGGGSPAPGNNTEIILNSGGLFYASAGMTFDHTDGTFAITNNGNLTFASAGQLLVNRSTVLDIPSAGEVMQVQGDFALGNYGATNKADIDFYYARGSEGSEAVPNDTDLLGTFRWNNWDGGDFNTSAMFGAIQQGSVTANRVPTALVFNTESASADGIVERMRIEPDGLIRFNSTGAVVLNVGDTSERPSAPEDGMIRYNTDSGKFEAHQAGAWQDIITSAVGGGASPPDRGIQFSSGGVFYASSSLTYSDTGTVRLTSGGLAIGGAADTASPDFNTFPAINVIGGSGIGSSDMILMTIDNSPSTKSDYAMYRARGTGVGDELKVENGDHIGSLRLRAHDGVDWHGVGGIFMEVTGPTASNDIPTDMSFSVSNGTGFEAMRLTSAGWLGLGTSTPAQPLDVTDADPDIRMTDTNGIGESELLWHNSVEALSRARMYYDFSNSYLGIDTDRDGDGDGELRFYLGATEQMRLTSTGRLGIGTSTPVEMLDVVTTNNAVDSKLMIGSGADPFSTAHSALKLREIGVGTYETGFDLVYDGDVNTFSIDSVLNFASTSRLLIERDTGSVGLGVADPSTILDIAGTLQIADGGETCSAAADGGMIRWNGAVMEYCDGAAWQQFAAGAVATPGAPDRGVQFNSGGAFTASSDFAYSSLGVLQLTGGGADGEYIQTLEITNNTGEFMRMLNSADTPIIDIGTNFTDEPEITLYDDGGNPRGQITGNTLGGAIFEAWTDATVLADGGGTSYGAGLFIQTPAGATGENGISFNDGAVSSPPAAAITSYDTNAALLSRGGLRFKTNDIGVGGLTTRMQIDGQGLVSFTSTGAIVLPAGTDAMRPGVAEAGMLRFSSTSNNFEGYDGTAWGPLAADSSSINFVSLGDTPASYAGQGGRFTRVNAGETGIEFTDEIIESVTGEPAPTAMVLDDVGDVIVGGAANGECLKFNGTDWVSGSCSVSGGTAADGSDRQIQFNSAGVLGADANFVFNNSGYLGVGTASPGYPLQVDSPSLSEIAYFSSNNSNYARVAIDDNSGGKNAGLALYTDGVDRWTMSTFPGGTNDDFLIYNEQLGGVAPFRIIGDTNRVSIGSLPFASSQLHVDGTIQMAYSGEVCDADREGAIHYDSAADNFFVCADSANGWEALGSGAAGVINFVSLGDTPVSYVAQAGRFVRVNSGETAVEFTDEIFESVTGEPVPGAMVLNDLGNVGTGTPNDNSILSYDSASGTWVAADASSAGAAGADTQIQFNSGGIFGASADFVWDNASSELTITTGSDSLALRGDRVVGTNDVMIESGSGNQVIFSEGNTEIGRFAGGLLGIGDWSGGGDTIEDSLHLQSGGIMVDGGAGNERGCIRFDDTNDKIQFSHDCISYSDMGTGGGGGGGDDIWEDSGSGYIQYPNALGGAKLGTTSGGATPVSNFVDVLNDLANVNTTPADGEVLMYSAGAGEWIAGTADGSPAGSDREIQFNSGGVMSSSSGFTYSSAGDLAVIGGSIGVSENDDSLKGVGVVNANAGASTEAGFFAATDAGEIGIGIHSTAYGYESGAAYVWSNGIGPLYFGTTDVERMRIMSTGEVGIGKLTADTLLDVDGTIKMAYGGEACDASREGAIHYDSAADNFFVCADSANGWEALGSGASGTINFVSLGDTPSTYAAQAGKFVRVNTGETAVEFTDEIIESVAGNAPVGMALNNLSDVNTTPVDNSVLTYDSASGDWIAGAAGSGGLWTDNTTHISYASAHILNNGETMTTAGFDGGNYIGMVWHPDKGAFRAGRASGTEWDEANIGTYSFAVGESAGATNWHSFAIGVNASAQGGESFVMGSNLLAQQKGFVLGYNAETGGSDYNMAIGIADTAGASPKVTGAGSLGVFMDDFGAYDLTYSSTFALVGGRLMVDDDGSAGSEGCIRYNGATSKIEFSHDCSVFTEMGDGSSTAIWSDSGAGYIEYNSSLGGILVGAVTGAAAPEGAVISAGGGGSSDFLSLTDVDPSAYTGQAGKVVAVNTGATGLEFIDAASSGKWDDAVAGGDIRYMSGDVGIGVSDPAQALDVAGSIKLTSSVMFGLTSGAAAPTGLALNDLNDVTTGANSNGEVLMYSGGTWSSETVSLNMNDLGDVDTTGAADDEILIYSAGSWVVGTLPAGQGGFWSDSGSGYIDYASSLGGIKVASVAGNAPTSNIPSTLNDLTNVNTTPNDGDCLSYVSGSGEWQASSSCGGGAGDDLGDHTATQDLDLSANDLIGAADITYTGMLNDISDRRLKTDIHKLETEEVIGKLTSLDTYSFRMKADPEGRVEYGVMAQEVEKVFPHLVKTADDEMGTMSVNYTGFIAPLIEASKELKAENDALRAELADMKLAQADILREVKGLKAHTGYGIGKAEIGLWMVLGMAASGILFFLGFAIIRRRRNAG